MDPKGKKNCIFFSCPPESCDCEAYVQFILLKRSQNSANKAATWKPRLV